MKLTYIIGAIIGIAIFFMGNSKDTKPFTLWEETYIELNTFNGQRVRIKKDAIDLYKYNPKWAYTDVYVNGLLAEIREIPEEIDELLGRTPADPQEVEK